MKTLPADDTSERRQLEAWIAQFSPEISERARGGLAALRENSFPAPSNSCTTTRTRW